MATVKIEVQASKELYELGQGVASFLAKVKAASKDGLGAEDLGVLLTAAITDLVPAVNGIDKISDEFKEDYVAFANAVAITGTSIVSSLVG